MGTLLVMLTIWPPTVSATTIPVCFAGFYNTAILGYSYL